MRVFHGQSFAHVYARAAAALVESPDNVRSPRGMRCAEVTPAVFEYPVGRHEDALITSPTRSTNLKYLAAELLWYYEGRRDAAGIGRFAKLWLQLADTDGNVNSAYGWQVFRKKNDHGHTEWEWAMQSLLRDPDTRQAVMLFHAPRHHYMGNPDVPCTMNAAFSRRGEHLDLITTMRSQDVWWGLTYDAPFFVSLLRNACLLHGLAPGSHFHIVYNLHAYEKDWGKLRAMVDSGVSAPAAADALPRQRLPWVDMYGQATPAFTSRADPLAARLQEASAWS